MTFSGLDPNEWFWVLVHAEYQSQTLAGRITASNVIQLLSEQLGPICFARRFASIKYCDHGVPVLNRNNAGA